MRKQSNRALGQMLAHLSELGVRNFEPQSPVPFEADLRMRRIS